MTTAGPPLLNLTTHQLQYLTTVSRCATLVEAAEQLRISQSALSQGLTELERRVGVELFERRGRNRVLTARGRDMVALADRVLAATRDLTIWASATASGRQGLVRLGLIDIAAVNYFPDTLIDFRKERPGIELRLSVAPSATLTGRLLEGRLDVAILVEPPPNEQHEDLELIDLLTEELAIYAPEPEHGRPGPPAVAHRAEPLHQAAGRVGPPSSWGPWVTFPPESHTRRHIARALRDEGAEFRVEAESNQPDVLRQMVRLGMGWTVLPVLQAETEPNPLVRARPVPLLTRRLMVARRRGATADPAVTDLVARLRRRAESLGGEPVGQRGR